MSRLGFFERLIHKPALPFKFSCDLGQTYGKTIESTSNFNFEYRKA